MSLDYLKEMQVGVFHPGTQHSWQTALALQDLGRLAWYATSIFHQPDRFPYLLADMLPGGMGVRLKREFARVGHPRLDPALVRTSGAIEWLERLASRARQQRLAMWLDAVGNRRFARNVAKELDGREPVALWGYNGSSLTAFELAKPLGRPCILDRTNGDYRIYNAMMAEIAERDRDWFGLSGELAKPAETIAADQREYELADRILVGSPFAARTIAEATADPAIAGKVEVLNYCFDESLFAGAPSPTPLSKGQPVRFLFLGLVIPRKGIQHVLDAFARLPEGAAELTIVGTLGVPRRMMARFEDRITYLPTVPRSEVPRIMQQHHVFLLPSYFEGAGITLYEALASGCALIQSRNCAEAVTPETGIMLDRIDTDAVHEAMLVAIEERERLNAWRNAAQAEAANYTFAHYRANISALLDRMEI